MSDMSAIITPKSDQINADDLLGRTQTITVTEVKIRGGQEQPISIHFEGSDKVFRPCKSMCRVMAQAWGLDSARYSGRSMTLYCDPSVKFGPLAVGGIRISHMTDIDGPMTMALTATKGVKKSYKVLPLVMPAGGSQQSDGPTIADARAAVADADTLESLQLAWKQRWMAPFRDELAGLLADRKSALATHDPDTGEIHAGEGPADEQRGEAHTDAVTPETILSLIQNTDDADLVDGLLAVHAEAIASFGGGDARQIRGAANARKIELQRANA